ncbi:MAG: sulfatase [Planctomycetaceae bacterium]|nr:sulfatase [Planctomycetaceae bacterium]
MRIDLLSSAVRLLLIVALSGWIVSSDNLVSAAAPNILFISVDDMSCDSVGVFGCALPDTTPNIDRLASQGMRFEYAHVQVGNCMPSRNVMFSGRYPHSNGVEGFYQVRNPDYPVLCDLMKEAGFFTAIRGKVSHSTPYSPYAWDLVLDEIDGDRQHIKDVQSYYRSAARGIEAAGKAGKPFCLLINVSDPHKPFYGMNGSQTVVDDPHVPSRIFSPDEVPIPGFLFDHPSVRLELAHYYSSVRRADDCVGAVLKALSESQHDNDTVVVFLSDHGMPLPFAKTALYHHSTHTPWIVRWPGVVAAGGHDTQHMISAVDLLPTLLDVAAIDHPEGLQGRSIVPLLRGESQSGRNMVFKEYNENSGGFRNPMRSVQTRKFGYIFNPWSNGSRTFRTATTGTLAYRTMRELSATDSALAARLHTFEYAQPEQFFDYEKDPDALHNLIDDPRYSTQIAELRQALECWMEQTEDHALPAFRNRTSPEALEEYMEQVQSESDARRSTKRKNNRPGKRKKAAAGEDDE